MLKFYFHEDKHFYIRHFTKIQVMSYFCLLYTHPIGLLWIEPISDTIDMAMYVDGICLFCFSFFRNSAFVHSSSKESNSVQLPLPLLAGTWVSVPSWLVYRRWY